MPTFTAHTAIGQREDLTDIIYTPEHRSSDLDHGFRS